MQVKLEEINFIDDEICNLKQKVQANIFYIDEELIKTIGSSTEKKIKILEENIDLIRMDRLQILQKENQILIQLKIMQRDENLMSFNPKKKVFSKFYNFFRKN